MNAAQNSGPHDSSQANERLTNLELLFTHLERQLAELSQMVLEQGRQLERLERELRRQRDAAGRSGLEPTDDQADEGTDWQ